MTEAILSDLQAANIAYEEDVSMCAKTSFKIGGAAQLMLFPAGEEQLQTCLRLCKQAGETPFILGCGSNLLVKDSGIDGVVISTERLTGIACDGGGLVSCGAGTKLSELCVFAQKHGLSGLEFAYGIPGSAGGAAYMNAGAYGGEMKDVLHSVRYADPAGELHALAADALELGYRHSVFMQNGGVVTGLSVRLQTGDAGDIRAKMDKIMRKRLDKQPLEFPSAGSVFKRPEGQFAGALIEQCGLKGKSVGGAQVSDKHAGFIVNTGGATAADVRALIAVIQSVVENETAVFLEPEIRFV